MGNRSEAVCYLDDLFADVDDASSTSDMACIAGVALDLAACNAAILDKLAPLKERLREYARTQIEGKPPSTIRILGDMGGVVTVTFPKDQVKLNKACDIETLRSTLGESFDDFFDTRTTYKPVGRPSVGRVASLDNKTAEVLMDSIELSEPTPRVGFKP